MRLQIAVQFQDTAGIYYGVDYAGRLTEIPEPFLTPGVTYPPPPSVPPPSTAQSSSLPHPTSPAVAEAHVGTQPSRLEDGSSHGAPAAVQPSEVSASFSAVSETQTVPGAIAVQDNPLTDFGYFRSGQADSNAGVERDGHQSLPLHFDSDVFASIVYGDISSGTPDSTFQDDWGGWTLDLGLHANSAGWFAV